MLKNIIFDVGDVLLEYRWKDMLREHGLSEPEAERVGTAIFDHPLWGKDLDLGLKTQQEVINGFRREMPEEGTVIEWFITHGEQMVVPRPEIWELVRELKGRGYRIYLLSNYSEELFQKHTRGADFMEAADGMVVSYQVHLVKPDPGIYNCLLTKYGLRPEECLFFDDRSDNVEAARRLGIAAEQVTTREMLGKRLKEILNK